MKHKIIIITILALIFAISSWAASSGSCRSGAGGYCMNLAAAAQTQTAGALDFLGNPDTIGVLVANLYYFGLGLVAVAAFIMMVFGGFTYMTAGDNAGRVKEGQEYMKNAVFGLVLALISWLILFTINPDLVKSLDLAIPKIELKQATVPVSTTGTYSGDVAANFGNVLGTNITPITSPSQFQKCTTNGGTTAKVGTNVGVFATASPASAYCITSAAQSCGTTCTCVKWVEMKDYNTGQSLGKYCIQ